MACNAFGVINLRGFIHDDMQSNDVLIELGTSHLVTEVFDRELNQWIFIDGDTIRWALTWEMSDYARGSNVYSQRSAAPVDAFR